MKKIIVFTFGALLVLLASGCNDFLGIKPKGFLIPETVKDYEGLLSDPQLLKSSDTYPIYLTDDAYIPDEDPFGYFISMLSADEATRNLYTFQSEVFGESENDYLWELSYNRIYTYNVIIEDIMEASEGTEQEKKAIYAEALMGRAFEYLNLVNAYAVQYDPKTADKDLGVPLMLDKDITKTNLERATVQEVYDLIVSSLTEANQYLPTKPKGNAFRASKAAGLGILSRTYLYMGDFQNAKKYAEESLKVNNTLFDMTQCKVVDPYGVIGWTDMPSRGNNPENIYIRLAPYVYGVSMMVYGSDELMALYTENDMRYQLFYTQAPFGVPVDRPLWFPWLETNLAIATPEVYLTLAECEARIGSKDKAMEYINTLRDYRIIDNQPLTATTNDEALDYVLEERRRELAFSGLSRVIDLKRLNKEPRFAKTITRIAEGETYTLEPNSPLYVLPIPAKILRFNPDMPDNIRK